MCTLSPNNLLCMYKDETKRSLKSRAGYMCSVHQSVKVFKNVFFFILNYFYFWYLHIVPKMLPIGQLPEPSFASVAF
jgi:hypothetical protein